MKLKTALSLLLASSILHLGSQPAYAQDSVSITAIPPRLEANVKPGQTINTTLKIRNESDSTQTYTINLTDFIVSDTVGTPIPVTQIIAGRYASSSWIKTPKIITVDSKTTQPVNITITAPIDAAPGGHYALLTYQLSDAKPSEFGRTGSVINPQTGTLFYITVPGNVTQSALISSFKTDKFHEFGPVNFDIQVKNNSDIHVAPQGKLVITDFLNNVVSTQTISMANIFPGSTRDAFAKWDQKWGYGRYSANLELTYGTAGTVINSTILFWLFPIRLVIYILVLVISLLSAIIIVKGRQSRHQHELEAEVEELKKELQNLGEK